jgi:cyclophilin family peptidyl-prolyl cis-trans isomerase
MNKLLLALCIPFLGLQAVLPAQQEGDKPKPPPAKVEKTATAKDDVTSKDPAVVAIDKFIAEKNVDKKADGWRLRLSAPPKQTFDAEHDYFLHMDTSEGLLKVRLFGDTAPMHATSGLYLARLGFYDGLNFHRIITQFMAQGGCPQGNGRGGPGYQFGSEFVGKRKHDKPGLLSMANAGEGTDGSQFFLTFVPTPWLDGKHTIWGEVVEGMETVKKLEALGSRGGEVQKPPTIVKAWASVVKKAKAEEKPKAAEAPKEEKAK